MFTEFLPFSRGLLSCCVLACTSPVAVKSGPAMAIDLSAYNAFVSNGELRKGLENVSALRVGIYAAQLHPSFREDLLAETG